MSTASLPLLDAPQTTPGLQLDPRTYDRALSCVHCGLCLPVCPTYVTTGHEADSPRGRIQLMRGLADGEIEATESVRHHLDLCLDCRACETACPSAVVYHELIEETREKLRESSTPRIQSRLLQWIFFNIFIHPTRLKLALLPARLMQKVGLYNFLRRVGFFKILPPSFAKMEQMLPPDGALWPKSLPAFTRSTGVPPAAKSDGQDARATTTVAFFPGCIGSVMFEKVNRQAVELLAACGANVIIAPTQVCCGAIHHHSGVWEPARELARRNIDAILPESGSAPDYITSNIAGCGAMLHEYDHLLRDDPKYAARAKEFSRRAKDISEVLLELGLPPMSHRVDKTVIYHEACHLIHAQRVSVGPRKLLASVPGLKLVSLPEADMCCGAAGTYNLTQPEMATELAQRKLANIALTHSLICITGNVGCAMHIQSQAIAQGQQLDVIHPVEILHEAVFGPPHR
jgi:glycolate oxidase iron-sulfur subunit